MKYTAKTLKRIGISVVQNHAHIAESIVAAIPKPLDTDLGNIPRYFAIFCRISEFSEQELQGPVYKSALTEAKKVFLGAMIKIYADQRMFNNTISTTLGHLPCMTTRLSKEVNFRYSKDDDFKQKVDDIFTSIFPLP